MEKETVETKKCKNCLRRIAVEHYRCPYCRTSDFIFDGVLIEWEKHEGYNLAKQFLSLFIKLWK